MMVRQRVQFKKTIGGTKKYATFIVSGRNQTELLGRVEKIINDKLHRGWELR